MRHESKASCHRWQAAKSGKILIDSDMTYAENGIEAPRENSRTLRGEVYVYKDEQACGIAP